MYFFFMTILIGISLSMDAFSLALLYGTNKLSIKDNIILSLIVGVFHFIMPLLGIKFGSFIIDTIGINMNFLVLIVFSIIGIEMIISSIKKEDIKVLTSYYSYILFGLSVSIDSFTTGIGINIINLNNYIIALIFAIISSIFTYMGLLLGNKISNRYGSYSSLIGGILLIILGIYFYIK